jgi:hypothetical protein
MNRGGMVAMMTIGPLAVGVCAFLLVVALVIWGFTADEQKLASATVGIAITVAVGAVLVIAIAQFVAS